MSISVAMAVYNGEKYLKEQIDSILPQLKEEDELVISYNFSEDGTEDIIRSYEKSDSRVKVYVCKEKGVIPNFENAIRKCTNEIIFLSDQDDVWDEKKVEIIIKIFSDKTIGAVAHDCVYIDKDRRICKIQPRKQYSRKISLFEIIKRNPVQGSCLAFRRELRDFIIPFPDNIPMHDSWIGARICMRSKLIYIENKLILYRQHDESVTKRNHKRIPEMVKDRLCLLKRLIISRF